MFKEKRKKNVPALAKAIAQSAVSPFETIVFRLYNGRSSSTDLRLLRHKGEASRTVNTVVPVSFDGSCQKGEIQAFFVEGPCFENSVSQTPVVKAS